MALASCLAAGCATTLIDDNGRSHHLRVVGRYSEERAAKYVAADSELKTLRKDFSVLDRIVKEKDAQIDAISADLDVMYGVKRDRNYTYDANDLTIYLVLPPETEGGEPVLRAHRAFADEADAADFVSKVSSRQTYSRQRDAFVALRDERSKQIFEKGRLISEKFGVNPLEKEYRIDMESGRLFEVLPPYLTKAERKAVAERKAAERKAAELEARRQAEEDAELERILSEKEKEDERLARQARLEREAAEKKAAIEREAGALLSVRRAALDAAKADYDRCFSAKEKADAVLAAAKMDLKRASGKENVASLKKFAELADRNADAADEALDAASDRLRAATKSLDSVQSDAERSLKAKAKAEKEAAEKKAAAEKNARLAAEARAKAAEKKAAEEKARSERAAAEKARAAKRAAELAAREAAEKEAELAARARKLRAALEDAEEDAARLEKKLDEANRKISAARMAGDSKRQSAELRRYGLLEGELREARAKADAARNALESLHRVTDNQGDMK